VSETPCPLYLVLLFAFQVFPACPSEQNRIFSRPMYPVCSWLSTKKAPSFSPLMDANDVLALSRCPNACPTSALVSSLWEQVFFFGSLAPSKRLSCAVPFPWFWFSPFGPSLETALLPAWSRSINPPLITRWTSFFPLFRLF